MYREEEGAAQDHQQADYDDGHPSSERGDTPPHQMPPDAGDSDEDMAEKNLAAVNCLFEVV